MKPKSPPVKRRTTRRSSRSVEQVITGQLIFSTPVLTLATRLRERAALREEDSPGDELSTLLRKTADQITAAVAEGRKNEWLSVENFAVLVGLDADTVRKHCRMGKLDRAKKVGGVWLIHRSAVEIDHPSTSN